MDLINLIIRQGGALSVQMADMANLFELVDWGLWELMNSEATDWIDGVIEEEMEAAVTLLIEQTVQTTAKQLVAIVRSELQRRAVVRQVVEGEQQARLDLVREWRAAGVVGEVLGRPGVLARLLGYVGRPLKRVEPSTLCVSELCQAGFPLLAAELGPPEESKRRRVPVVRYEPGVAEGGVVSTHVATHRLEARRFVVACMNLTGFAVATEERYGITSAMLRVVLGID